MKTLPDDENTWTDEQLEYHRSLVARHSKLQKEIMTLTIKAEGGFSEALGWIGLECFEPGASSIQIDGDVTAQDVKMLAALFAIPSMWPDKGLEEFDFAKFEAIRDGLRAKLANA